MKNKYPLRGYQKDSIEDILSFIDREKKVRTVAVLPCAAGKSLIIGKLAKRIGGAIIVLQPSKELLEQNYEKFLSYGGEAKIFSASKGIKEVGDITFATPLSLKGSVKEFKKLKVNTIIIDECDMSTKKGGVIDNIIKALNPKNVIGLTATPINMHTNLEMGTTIRMINEYHKNIFTSISHITQTSTIDDLGFWSKVKVVEVSQEDGGLVLNSTGADYTLDSMIKYYSDNGLHYKILETFDKYISSGRKHGLIFCTIIEQANALAKADSRIKVISAETSKVKREEILKLYKKGVVKGIATCMAVAVGFDFPELDFGILARPTSSYRIYYQQIGRFLRIHEDKDYSLIVDMSGNYRKFGHPREMTYEYIEGYGWAMFFKDYLMTKVNLSLGFTVTRQDLMDSLVKEKEILSIMPFGKHKGTNLSKVPKSYLSWLLNNKTFDWSFLGNNKDKFIEECRLAMLEVPETDTPQDFFNNSNKRYVKKPKEDSRHTVKKIFVSKR